MYHSHASMQYTQQTYSFVFPSCLTCLVDSPFLKLTREWLKHKHITLLSGQAILYAVPDIPSNLHRLKVSNSFCVLFQQPIIMNYAFNNYWGFYTHAHIPTHTLIWKYVTQYNNYTNKLKTTIESGVLSVTYLPLWTIWADSYTIT